MKRECPKAMCRMIKQDKWHSGRMKIKSWYVFKIICYDFCLYVFRLFTVTATLFIIALFLFIVTLCICGSEWFTRPESDRGTFLQTPRSTVTALLLQPRLKERQPLLHKHPFRSDSTASTCGEAIEMTI